MKKLVQVKPKKARGSRASKEASVAGLRMSPALRRAAQGWADGQADKPTLSEAVRRLIELGLTVMHPPKQRSPGRQRKANEMAGRQLDKLADGSASFEEQADRKRQLLKGPEEFRKVRVDRTKQTSGQGAG